MDDVGVDGDQGVGLVVGEALAVASLNKAVDHESAGDPGAGHGDLEDALGGLGGAGGAESALGVGGGHVLGCR